MTRWLAAAQRAYTPTDKTDKTDKTQLPVALPALEGNPDPVLSDKSVLSERGKTESPSTRVAIIQAMQMGRSRPGAIATAARLGVTETYQELDRMAQAGFVTVQRNGALGLTAAADRETPTWK